jgi:hypothetical protein
MREGDPRETTKTTAPVNFVILADRRENDKENTETMAPIIASKTAGEGKTENETPKSKS